MNFPKFGKKKDRNRVIIDDVEYFLDEMSEEQTHLLQQVVHLDKQIAELVQVLEQRRVAREAFLDLLKSKLQPAH